MKSKRDSLEEIIEEEKPTIIALVETLLEEEEHLKIEGYKVLPKNKQKEGGRGILVAVREELENITMIIGEEETPGEQLWINIKNERINIRIGVIYAPQESRTKQEDLNIMYKQMKKHIEEGKQEGQKIIIMGDFNCKIGKYIKNNKEEVTKGGRLLLKIIGNHYEYLWVNVG